MGLSNFFGILDISASGLSAQRKNLEVRAYNIANSESVDPETGQPYTPREVFFSEIEPNRGFKAALNRFKTKLVRLSNRHISSSRSVSEGISMGVKATTVEVPDGPTKRIYSPSHPLADENGYVEVADVNPVHEMVKLLSASRAYEANATVMSAAKNMFKKALEI
jgi:flagellar basal-body rod protein FlgC